MAETYLAIGVKEALDAVLRELEQTDRNKLSSAHTAFVKDQIGRDLIPRLNIIDPSGNTARDHLIKLAAYLICAAEKIPKEIRTINAQYR